MHMNNCPCELCRKDRLIDYGSIKSLEKAGIGCDGKSAWRLDPEKDIADASARMKDMLELARKAAEQKAKVKERPEHLEEERIKAIQQKQIITHGEQLELLFLLERKWEKIWAGSEKIS